MIVYKIPADLSSEKLLLSMRHTGRFCLPAVRAPPSREGIRLVSPPPCASFHQGHLIALRAETRLPPYVVKSHCCRKDSDAHAGMIIDTGRLSVTHKHMSAQLITEHSLMRCVTSSSRLEASPFTMWERSCVNGRTLNSSYELYSSIVAHDKLQEDPGLEDVIKKNMKQWNHTSVLLTFTVPFLCVHTFILSWEMCKTTEKVEFVKKNCSLLLRNCILFVSNSLTV